MTEHFQATTINYLKLRIFIRNTGIVCKSHSSINIEIMADNHLSRIFFHLVKKIVRS